MRHSRCGALACLAVLSACARDDAKDVPRDWAVGASGVHVAADGGSDGDGAPPLEAATTGHLARRDLVESSGAAMSTTQPGVLFTINDSDNEPVLYATDTTGADRGAWRVTGARNADWESISMGPCGDGGAARCVYVGDTGDNDARLPTRTIYRVPEPAVTAAGSTGATAPAEALTYTYAGGPRDVEAMYVGPDGAITLVTKRPLRALTGRRRPALVFRLGADAWRAGRPAVAELVDSLPTIVPGTGPGGSLVTDAALAPDGRHVAVRTYTQVVVFDADPATGRPRPARAAACDVSALGEPTGEGVAWLDTSRLVLTSEGRGSAIHVVRCPMPDAPGR